MYDKNFKTNDKVLLYIFEYVLSRHEAAYNRVDLNDYLLNKLPIEYTEHIKPILNEIKDRESCTHRTKFG